MSQETAAWLNNMTLIGFTEKRAKAWHYQEALQGDEPNHYVGAIPVEDVVRRLFGWHAVEGNVSSTYTIPERIDAEGVTPEQTITIVDNKRKTIIRPAGALGPDDKGAVLYVPKSGYQIHQYDQWLVRNIATLLDDDLQIGSAGLLKGGALAWVQVEMPDTITTPEGVSFRPYFSAATANDGSLSSTYMSGANLIVCDNTMWAALGATDALKIKIRHSVGSLSRLHEARNALQLVHEVADDFAAEVKALCQVEVSDKAWEAFLDAHLPLPIVAEGGHTRSRTLIEGKRDEYARLWNHDERVSPWRGTAFGVLQADNTFRQHFQSVKNVSRVQRNRENTVTGKTGEADQATMATLQKVLASV